LLRFLHKISRKNAFRKTFQKFGALYGFSLSRYANITLLSAILLWVHIMLKKFEKNDTSTFICCLYQVKEAHKKIYKEEKS